MPASSPFLLYPFPFFSLVLATLVSLLAGCVARWAATAFV